MYQIVVPPGVRPGQTIKAKVPVAAPPPSAARRPETQPHKQQQLAARQSTASPQPPPPSQRSGTGSDARWSGWFVKQQPNFPHAWQKRFGRLVPRGGSSQRGFELVYYTNESDAANMRRRGSVPMGWPQPKSVSAPPVGRVCLEHFAPNQSDHGSNGGGKLALLVHSAERDYHLMINEPLSRGARFYHAYRVQCCGDLPTQALASLGLSPSGPQYDDGNLVQFSLSRLFEEQERLSAMGFDKFDCAAVLSRAGGSGDDALAQLVSWRGVGGGGGQGHRSTTPLDYPQQPPRSVNLPQHLPQQHWQPQDQGQSQGQAQGQGQVGQQRARAGTAPAAAASPVSGGDGGSNSGSSLKLATQRELETMGFSVDDAAKGAARHPGGVDAAMLWLLSQPAIPTPPATPPATTTTRTTTTRTSSSNNTSGSSMDWGNPRWEFESSSSSSSGGSGGAVSQWEAFRSSEQDQLNVALACGTKSVGGIWREGSCHTVHLDSLTMFRDSSQGGNGGGSRGGDAAAPDDALSFMAVRCIGGAPAASASSSSPSSSLHVRALPPLPARPPPSSTPRVRSNTIGTGGSSSSSSRQGGGEGGGPLLGMTTTVLPAGSVVAVTNDAASTAPSLSGALSPPPPYSPAASSSSSSSSSTTPSRAATLVPVMGDLLGLEGAEGADQDESSSSGKALFAKLLTSPGTSSFDGGGDGDGAVCVAEVFASSDHAECAICFEDLCAMPVALFFDGGGKRVCQHIFHCECCAGLKSCPLCNRPFVEARQLPDPLEKPKSWFAMVDFDSKGALTRKDVEEALKAQLPIRTHELETHFEALWQRWDATGSGDLSLKELFRPKDGLLDYLRIAKEGLGCPASPHGPEAGGPNTQVAPLEHASSSSSSSSAAAVGTGTAGGAGLSPPSLSNGGAWFAHFDADGSGYLDVNELVSAVNACLSRETTATATATARFTAGEETVGVLMAACDLRSPDRVDKDEFLQPGGLAEVLAASLGIS